MPWILVLKKGFMFFLKEIILLFFLAQQTKIKKCSFLSFSILTFWTTKFINPHCTCCGIYLSQLTILSRSCVFTSKKVKGHFCLKTFSLTSAVEWNGCFADKVCCFTFLNSWPFDLLWYLGFELFNSSFMWSNKGRVHEFELYFWTLELSTYLNI